MRNAGMQPVQDCGLAPRPARRYKGRVPGGEGDAGAAVVCGRAITKYRGFSVIDIAGKRVALYARHSTEAQDRSVPAQLERCREVARRQAATVVEEFVDEGISGAVLQDRLGIMALIAAAAHGEFQAVLVEDLSRVSRDQADVATIYKRLIYHGVVLVSVTEGPINELWIGLKGTMNALYLSDLKDKIRRGLHAAVANGGIPGGLRYGYDTVPSSGAGGLVTINEAEAAVVRRIFAEVAAGRPYREVARALNAEGIPSATGTRWHASTLVGTATLGRGLLRNPLYRGRIVYGRVKKVLNPVTGRPERSLRPESEWTIIEAPELAIVPGEQWDAVQAIIEAKRPGRQPGEHPPAERPPRASKAIRHITSGRIWCGDCGARVTTAHSGYLICQTWRTTRSCRQNRMFRRGDVIEALARRLASPGNAKAVHTAAAAEAEVRRTRSIRLGEGLAALEQATAAVQQAAEALGSTAEANPAWRRAIRDLAIPEDEIDALAHRITATRAALALEASRAPVDAIAAAAHARIAATARTHAGEREGADPQHRRLLQDVIERITVAWRGGARKRLEVAVTLSPAAVYELGVEEFGRQGDHGAAPAPAPSPA